MKKTRKARLKFSRYFHIHVWVLGDDSIRTSHHGKQESCRCNGLTTVNILKSERHKGKFPPYA
jgi:hypothetical protein